MYKSVHECVFMHDKYTISACPLDFFKVERKRTCPSDDRVISRVVLYLCRHVQVLDEKHDLAAGPGTHGSGTGLHQMPRQQVLHPRGGRESGERRGDDLGPGERCVGDVWGICTGRWCVCVVGNGYHEVWESGIPLKPPHKR